MKKTKGHIENKNLNPKMPTLSKIKINLNYFSIELVPYNKVLKELILFLQKKLSTTIFNEVYKHFINELKKYLNLSSLEYLEKQKNNQSKNSNGNIYNGSGTEQKEGNVKLEKKYIKKNIKPLVGLSYYHKNNNLNPKNTISSSSFSNLNFNNLDINFMKVFSTKYNYIHFNKKSINKTISNSNSQERDSSYANNFQFSNNISYLSNYKEVKNSKRNAKNINTGNNKFKINEKLLNNNQMLLNKNNKTINTSIKNRNNNKLKKIINTSKNSKKENNNNISSNDTITKKRISNNKTLTNIPHQAFIDLNKTKPNNSTNKKYKSIERNSSKNTHSKSKNFYNECKNKFNFDERRKKKIINIKLINPKNNGGTSILKPLQNSEEMLKKVKSSLEDDNLKVMFNFSYENFLSKESERESKEVSEEE